jgi:hypothetical protein
LTQKRNFFLELLEYFQNHADALGSEAKGDRIYPNKGDIGSERENNLFDFINNHIPFRCKVIKGGFIFDSNGNESNQIDLIVTNDLTFQFRKSESSLKRKSFNCIEGCYAAISVKSYLNKKELIDSLENLESIPTEKKIIVNPYITNRQRFIDQIPQRIIFAYDGDSHETIQRHLKDYYSMHRLDQRSPDMIIVNNSFYIYRVGPEGLKIYTGEYFPPNTYLAVDKTKSAYIGAASLYQMISRIQAVSIISSHMVIDFEQYGKKLDENLVGLQRRISEL